MYDCIVSPDKEPVRSATREEILAHLQKNHYPKGYGVILGETLEHVSISIYKAKFG